MPSSDQLIDRHVARLPEGRRDLARTNARLRDTDGSGHPSIVPPGWPREAWQGYRAARARHQDTEQQATLF